MIPGLAAVPLVVGVTGHRDTREQDEAQLRRAFGELLEDFGRRYAASPIVVLTALAAGADSLAAAEALDRNIRVMACLPMSAERYVEDFTEAQRERFHALLARCSAFHIVAEQSDRSRSYLAAGAYIAHFSHILVAFWDGSQGHGVGGTADVVHLRRTGIVAPGTHTDAYIPDIGPVHHIVTPREGGPLPSNPFTVSILDPLRLHKETSTKQHFDDVLAHLDAYNRDTTQAGAVAPGLKGLMDRTDAEANRLQKRTLLFVRLLYVAALFAALAQILQRGLPGDVYRIATLAAAFAAYWLARRFDYENRYQDYRAVAEGLRVQIAWAAAGLVKRSVDTYYLKMQQSELQWIRLALRAAYLAFCERDEGDASSPQHPDCREWIRGQWRFYYRASRREAERKRLCDLAGRVALAIGFALTAVAGVLLAPAALAAVTRQFPALAGTTAHWVSGYHPLLLQLAASPIPIAVLLGTLLASYAAKRSFASNSKRYQRMFIVFDTARRRLNAVRRGYGGDPVEIVAELGRESLTEHADWLLQRREYPLSFMPS